MFESQVVSRMDEEDASGNKACDVLWYAMTSLSAGVRRSAAERLYEFYRMGIFALLLVQGVRPGVPPSEKITGIV